MDTSQWYSQLIKPSFAPPADVFGVVWGVLYPVIIISFGYVFYLYLKKKIKFAVLLPFILNIIFNLIFSPIQFILRSNVLAAVDITLVVITLLWAIMSIYRHSKLTAIFQIPYLLWGLFATILQYSITYLNWYR
jgi:translocator protein